MAGWHIVVAAAVVGDRARDYAKTGGTDSPSCGTTIDSACASIAQGIQRCAATGCGVLVAWDEYALTAPIVLRDGVNVYGGCVPPDTLHALLAAASLSTRPMRDAADGVPDLHAAIGEWRN